MDELAQCYLVGGAVRDKLLGLPVKERDWVVVGSSPEDMLEKGFKPVGKDFPVLLHPTTHEEYALARTERKTGKGYHGFECHYAPQVTLEQDLARRDLTINAMAEDAHGTLIDPYHGKADLEQKCLRHVSDAFSEDPVRILRLARFAARFAHLGFRTDKSTVALMQSMVAAGEVNALVPERCWQELTKALGEQSPWVFFDILNQAGALKILFPELLASFEDKGFSTCQAHLQKAVSAEFSNAKRYALLCYELSAEDAESQSARFRVSKFFQDLVEVSQKIKLFALEGKFAADTIENLFSSCDAYRQPQRFSSALEVVRVVSEITILSKLEGLLQQCMTVKAAPFVDQGLTGRAISQAIKAERVALIEQL